MHRISQFLEQNTSVLPIKTPHWQQHLTPERHSSRWAIGLAVLGVLGWLTIAPASASFPPVPSDPPGDTSSGGTRGESCLLNHLTNAPVTGQPTLSPSVSRSAALTPATHPTISLQIGPSLAERGSFALHDATGRLLYRTPTIALPANGGTIQIELPQDVSLAVNQTYRWTFEVMCGENLDPDNPVWEGQL